MNLVRFEAVFTQHPDIASCVVVAQGDKFGPKRLAAFVVAAAHSNEDLDIDQVSKWISDRVPAYMVPVLFRRLDSLPFSANGKIDRKALPNIRPTVRPSVAGKSKFSQSVTKIFTTVLGVEVTDQQESFFNMGGNSIEMVSVQSMLLKQLDVGYYA